jgi:flotillin
MLEILGNYIGSILIAVVVLVLIFSFWRKVQADKALVITGLRKRVLSGRGGFMIPILETSCTVSLENISMTTDINEAPSKQGIFINIIGTAVVKIQNDKESILKAVEQFCTGGANKTVENIRSIVEQILEGKLRGIISTLTVEQINEDRAAFEQRIENDIKMELESMGLLLISYSILKISTQGGYLENRAIPQIAQSKSDADVATAERKRDTDIKTAEAEREGKKAKLLADSEIAQSERDKSLKVEAFRAEQDKAKADADIAYNLKEIENQALVERQKAALADEAAIRVEKELIASVDKPAKAASRKLEIEAEAQKIKSIKEAEALAEATKVRAQADAEAKRIQAAAEADAIRLKGDAEASAIRARGLAEAEAKDKLAEAMAKYGDAAVVQMIVDRLPEIMGQIAKPLEQVDKITVIDNGGGQGASKVAKIVTDIAGNGFEVLKDMTGLDISDVIAQFVAKHAVQDQVISANAVQNDAEAAAAVENADR